MVLLDLAALRDARDTANWGKHIAARPYNSSVMPTESWSQAKLKGRCCCGWMGGHV